MFILLVLLALVTKIGVQIHLYNFLSVFANGGKNGAQKCNNESNSQSQLPRKHDSESANGYNPNGGKKPAKKPNKARCDKE